MTEPLPFDLNSVRQVYARQMLALANVTDDASLEAAFAQTPREEFLGAPPWSFGGASTRKFVTTSDPCVLYQDVVVALQAYRLVNNGSPSLHAGLLHALGVKRGSRVAHIGAGAGYYTAILARLAGPEGLVQAIEWDADLAAQAKQNLREFENVQVVCGDGALYPSAAVDAIYVSCGVARPAEPWIERLAPGGRLIFPLCAVSSGRKDRFGFGAALLVERRADRFAARFIGGIRIICVEGALAASREENDELAAVLKSEAVKATRSLIWKREIARPERCWLLREHWALSLDEPD